MSYTSPAMAHKRAVLAALEEEKIKAAQALSFAEKSQRVRAENKDFALALDALESDCKAISDLPQGARRIAFKRSLIAKYRPFVEDYVASGDVYENPILTQVMIWAFDCGALPYAQKLAAVAVAQNQLMPERYKRNVHTYVADALLDCAASDVSFSAADRSDLPAPPSRLDKALGLDFQRVQFLQNALVFVHDWPVHDIIKAKYYKLMAEAFFRLEKYSEALRALHAARTLAPELKVKTFFDKLNKIVNIPPPEETPL